MSYYSRIVLYEGRKTGNRCENHQKFNSLLFLACTSGYKSKKGEKQQAKKPSPFSEKADILPSTKKLKSVKKADEKSKMSKEKPNGNNVS